MRATVARLRAAGKTVFLFYPVPEAGHIVPETLAREVLHGRDPEKFAISARGIFFERQAFVMGLFDSLPDGPDLVRFKPHEMLISGGHLRLMENDEVFYQDDDHLSMRGAHELRPLFDKVFNHFDAAAKMDGKD